MIRYFIVFPVLLCCSCAAHYTINNNVVAHVSWNEGVGRVVQKIEEADPQTFEQLTPHYGKDKAHVFWWDTVVEGADASSFVALNDYYGVDMQHGVYRDKVILESEGSSFECLGNNWSRDSKDYFYGASALNVCDYDTFEIIEDLLSGRAIDNECYYYGSIHVPVDDIGALTVLPAGYAKDRSNVYWGRYIVKNADPATFEIKESMKFARDKNRCYSGPQVMECDRMTDEAKEFCRCE